MIVKIPRSTIVTLRRSTIGMLLLALFAAPCVGGLALTPIGLGAAFMTTGAHAFLEKYRYITMALALALVGLTIWQHRKSAISKRTWVAIALVPLYILVDKLYMALR